VTSLIQPLDQDVLQTLKRNYILQLLKHLLEDLENGKSVVESLKKINIKDIIYWLTEACDNVKPSTLIKCWKNILCPQNETSKNEMTNEGEMAEETLLELAKNLPVSKALTTEDIEEWMNDDEQQEMTNDMIINLVSQQKEESKEEEEDEVCTEVLKKISHIEGLNAIETALRYAEQQADTTPADILLLSRLWNIAAKKRGTVKDYLRK
jgi:hypothetical protein